MAEFEYRPRSVGLGDGQDVNLAEPFLDRRIPPVDVRGALADYQIRQSHLTTIAEHVSRNWRHVSSVRCRFEGGIPFFSIYLRSFSPSSQREHWPLGNWIANLLGETACRFLFLPEPIDSPNSSDVEIYSAWRGAAKRNAA